MIGRSAFQTALVSLMTVLSAAVFVGCRGEPASQNPVREEPFIVRPYDLAPNGAWIGNAICYGPHRDGQRPGEKGPSADEVREDLALMLPHWNLLRIYGSRGFAETLLEIIREDKLDMKVMLGAWIAPDSPQENQLEVEAAIRLTSAYPEIVTSISVGNETQIEWSAHTCPVDTVITLIRQVRAAVTVPVTSADDFNYWNKPASRALAAEVDFISTHAHPLWNGQQLDDALPWLQEQMAAIQALHPDRLIVLAETGWATMAHDEGEQAKLIKGVPGEAEQKQFYDATIAWALAEKIPVFTFEAFDENWKGGDHPNEVEKHWGLFRTDRTPKMVMVK